VGKPSGEATIKTFRPLKTITLYALATVL
jgi:hypothetical protein